jgi:hypothetical protein
VNFFTDIYNLVIHDMMHLKSVEKIACILKGFILQPQFLTEDLKEQLTPLGLRVNYRRKQKHQRQLAKIQNNTVVLPTKWRIDLGHPLQRKGKD